jgi:hypothetical protein
MRPNRLPESFCCTEIVQPYEVIASSPGKIVWDDLPEDVGYRNQLQDREPSLVLQVFRTLPHW